MTPQSLLKRLFASGNNSLDLTGYTPDRSLRRTGPKTRVQPILEMLEPRIYMSALPTPFANMDIGAPAIAGTAIYVTASNQIQATGAGMGVTGTSDQFNYTAENWIGSGTVQANVGAVANTGTNAQAGVMIRDTSAASSEFAAVMENPNGTISLDYRNNTSGAVTVAATTSSAVNPAWVQLSETQSGTTDSFTGYYSTDGVTWTAINSASVNMTFTGTTNLAGLAVTSGNAAQSQTVNFNSFSAIPINFTSQDIGGPAIAGSATYSSTAGNWTVNGGGSDIWNASDQFNFDSQSYTGDGSLVAQVTSQTNTDPWAKAGVMFRNDNTAGTMFADVVVTPGNGVNFQWRNSTGGQCGNAEVGGITAPVWVELTRLGNTFTAYYSTNGSTWLQIGSTQTISMNSTALAGLAVTSHNNSLIGTATFSNVSLMPVGWSDQNIGSPSASGSAQSNGTTWTVSSLGYDIWGSSDQFNFASQNFTGDGSIVAQINSQINTDPSAQAGVMFRNDNTAGANFVDVLVTPGNGVAFNWRSSGISYAAPQVTGTTTPVWVKLTRAGTSYSGYYSTDGSTWVQVGAVTISMNSTALAGLAVSSHNYGVASTATFSNVSLTAPVSQLVAPAAPTALTATAATGNQINLSWTAPTGTVTGYNLYRGTSPGGESTTPINGGTLITGTTYSDVGLLAPTTYYYTVEAVNAVGSSSASTEANATTYLPTGWSDQDIGTWLSAAGSAEFNGATWTVTSSGTALWNSSDLWNTGDQFNFASRTYTGDGSIVAQVTSQTDSNAWAKAGVMFRNDITAGSAFADVVATPGNGVVFEWRTASGVGNLHATIAGIAVPVWVKLTRAGSAFTAYYSTDGSTWVQIGTSETIVMNSTVLAGLAVVGNAPNNSLASTATFSNVSLTLPIAPSAAPAAPTALTATAAAANQINLSWTAPAGIVSGYNVYRGTTPGGEGAAPINGNALIIGTTYSDTTVSAPTTLYYYTVEAVNAAGSSAASTEASATTLPTGDIFSPSSFWYTPIPTNTSLNTNQSGLIAGLNYQVAQNEANWNGSYGDINTYSFSAPVYTVGANVPTVKVQYVVNGVPQTNTALNAANGQGQWDAVPIPSYAVAPGDDPNLSPADTDSEMVIYQPSTDTMWEFWLAHDVNGQWQAQWGGRMQNVSTSNGIWPDISGPNTSYGATATGLPLLGGQITAAELSSGVINHAIGIALPLTSNAFQPTTGGAYLWPATRGDGWSSSPYSIPEGTRFRLDPSINVDALGLSPVATIIATAAQKYGFVVWDTAGSISIRAENALSYTALGQADPYPSLYQNQAYYSVLNGFPWGAMQFMPDNYGQPVAPAAPAGLTATAVSSSQINLTWAAPAGPVTGYNIFRGTTSGGEGATPINSSPVTTTSYADTGLAAGTAYYYTVDAVNAVGSSPASTEATASSWQLAVVASYTAAPLAMPAVSSSTATSSLPSPIVTSFTINDGSAQRSMVTSAMVTFNEAVTLQTGAITLGLNGGDFVATTVTNPSGDGANYLVTFRGTGTTHGSLNDGQYTLTVHGTLVQNADGQAMATDSTFDFFRVFGDIDGNGVLNNYDFMHFKAAFGKSVGQAGYLALFDYNGDGVINKLDFLQFRRRHGMPI